MGRGCMTQCGGYASRPPNEGDLQSLRRRGLLGKSAHGAVLPIMRSSDRNFVCASLCKVASMLRPPAQKERRPQPQHWSPFAAKQQWPQVHPGLRPLEDRGVPRSGS